MTTVSSLLDSLRRGESPAHLTGQTISDPAELFSRAAITREQVIGDADISMSDLIGILHSSRSRLREVNYPLKLVTPDQAKHLAYTDQDVDGEFTGYCVLIGVVNGKVYPLLASLDGYPDGTASKMWIIAFTLDTSNSDILFSNSTNSIVSLFLPTNSWFK